MGNATRELTDCLHLLRLPQSIFSLPTLSDFGFNPLLKRFIDLAESVLGLPALKCHAYEVGYRLEKIDIMCSESAGLLAVNFQHPVRFFIAHHNDIDCASNVVIQKQLRDFKSVLARQVIGNDWVTGVQSVSGWGPQVSANRNMTDNTTMPAHTLAY